MGCGEQYSVFPGAVQIWYLLNARKKRETAILTCVAIQSVLFKATMFITFALVGICLIFEQ